MEPVAAAARGTSGRVVVAVGPEGGWNGFELALLQRHGFAVVGLGTRTLRVDTAWIALLAMVHAARGVDGAAQASRYPRSPLA